MSLKSDSTLSSTPEFLSGGGEMGQRMREYDWATTSLGPVDTWPQSLRTCVERGKRADDSRLALRDDQIGHRNDEQRRADDGKPKAIEQRRKSHKVS